MISNQTLATTLNALAVLAADRKKVKSVEFQENLIEAISDIGDELNDRGIELRTIKIRHPRDKHSSWTVPFVEEGNLDEGISKVIDVPSLIP